VFNEAVAGRDRRRDHHRHLGRDQDRDRHRLGHDLQRRRQRDDDVRHGDRQRRREAAVDLAGNANAASTSTDNTVTWDVVAPTVTINWRSAGDPTNGVTINYTVVFRRRPPACDGRRHPVRTAAGRYGHGAGSGTTYNVAVTGMTGSGTVIAPLPPIATDAAGNGNAASTSTDNTVTWDNVAPSVTINQAGAQADRPTPDQPRSCSASRSPTSSPAT
jgi:hypothetical protein